MSKPILVIIHLKSILIQTIQTTQNIENHFYINISKHKSILFNSLLIKINSIKLNSVKINSIHRQTKHIRNSTYEIVYLTVYDICRLN
jgi:hypothetical protein